MSAALIGVDWGTTHLRAALMSARGDIIEPRRTPDGLRAVSDKRFEPVLAAIVADWRALHGPLPVLCSGMVGARTGWIEAPYCATPADAGAIAGALVALDTATLGRVHFAPGVRQAEGGGARADVMRGEETQIVGALDLAGARDGLFVLPGTHSKWIEVEDGAIRRFSTFMTGDAYAALKDHTILSFTMNDSWSETGFHHGLDLSRALCGPADLLGLLFSLRVAALEGTLDPNASGSALSGLLIGAEMRQMAQDRAFTLVAGDALAQRYRTAAKYFGLEARVAPTTCAARGQWLLARAAGLIARGGSGT